jgi:hypothetical protein
VAQTWRVPDESGVPDGRPGPRYCGVRAVHDGSHAATDRLLVRQAGGESDDTASTQTTTALDSEIAFFDGGEYLVVDKVGAQIEFVPNLFDTSTGRPTGERGFLMHWRDGGKITDASPGALLVDKTSA